MPSDTVPEDDVWSRWLLSRDGGSPAYGRVLGAFLEKMRDRVLDHAQLREGITLLDVGAGDGLLAFGAIDRVGPSLSAILTDISAPLLRHTQAIAEQRGIAGQCKFYQSTAEQQDELWDASVDRVVTRAVLAFVADKPAAFKEFFRVLKPGGRFSIAEPILQDEALQAIALERHIESDPKNPQFEHLRLMHRLKAAQFPVTFEAAAANPLTNFNERDLLSFARDAGFVNLHLELHLDARATLVSDWDVYLNTSPHPWAPKTGDVLQKHFTADERERFEDFMRPILEAGKSIATDAFAYLMAEKPA